MNDARYLAIKVHLKSKEVKVYASPRIRQALEELVRDKTVYEGVRLIQVLEAVYNQGKKDGAREAFEETDRKFLEAKRGVPHKNPGQPKKNTKR
jgi:hypothetical protein